MTNEKPKQNPLPQRPNPTKIPAKSPSIPPPNIPKPSREEPLRRKARDTDSRPLRPTKK